MSRSFALWRMLPIVIVCWLMSTSGCGDVTGPAHDTLGDSLTANTVGDRFSWGSRNRVSSVVVTISPDTLIAGHQAAAHATAFNRLGDTLQYSTVAWSSTDSVAARVSPSGIVSGVAAGQAQIVATIRGAAGYANVLVVSDSTVAPVASVSVVLPAANLSVGSTMQAAAVVRDAQGNTLGGRVVSWSSSSPAIATANATTGAITGVAAGTVTITATSEGISGSTSLTVRAVTDPVAKVTVAVRSSTIYVGGTTTAVAALTDSVGQALTSRTVSWSSSNPSIAKVDSSSGVVTGVSVGTATITATSEGHSGSVSVAVQQVPVSTVTVNLTSSTVAVGSSTQATAVLKDSAGNVLTNRAIQWSSASPSVASVNASSGLVQGVAAGTATISATSGSATGQTMVTVTAPLPIPSKLVLAQQPSSSAISGQTFAQQPVIQLQDVNSSPVSQSGVSITVAIASGNGVLSGTTNVTTNPNGTATFSNLVITGSGVQTLVFTAPSLASVTSSVINVSASVGSLSVPDILNNGSFETGWDGFTDWSGSPSPTGVSRATDYAYSGSYSVRRSWTPNPGADVGSQFARPISSVDRVWVRFYFRLTAPITTIMKFQRFYNGGLTRPLGGFFLGAGNSIFQAAWDLEDAGIGTTIGLTQAQVIDGNWHSLEIDYWRNGDPSGYPSMAFWFDGNPQSLPDGTKVQYDCSTSSGTCNHSYWKGGRLYAGERQFSGKLDMTEWLATLNGGNTTTGQVNLDRVAISTLGHIGP